MRVVGGLYKVMLCSKTLGEDEIEPREEQVKGINPSGFGDPLAVLVSCNMFKHLAASRSPDDESNN